MAYSEPRMTIDVDIAVAIPTSELSQLVTIFPESEFYLPPQEVLMAENARECRAHFNVIHMASGLKADFYPALRDPFFAWAWQNRNEVSYESGALNFAPPEYILVWKTIYFAEGGSEKHLRDMRRMLAVSGDRIDRAILDQALGERGLLDIFRTRVETEV